MKISAQAQCRASSYVLLIQLPTTTSFKQEIYLYSSFYLNTSYRNESSVLPKFTFALRL